MHLIVKLTTAQRADLEELSEHFNKILRKQGDLSKTRATWTEKYGQVEQRIAKTELKANEGDLDASTLLIALKDQIMRLGLSIKRKQDEIDELPDERNRASARGIEALKGICKPLLARHRKEIADSLAPFYGNRFHAVNVAEATDSFGALQHFLQRGLAVPFTDPDKAEEQFNRVRAQLAALLETGVVFEFHGSDEAAA